MMRAFEHADPGTTPFDEQRRRAIFDQFVRDSAYSRVRLIVEGEESVGYVVLTVSFGFEYRDCDVFVDGLYIAEGCGGRGLGRRAIEFVEEVARQLGVNALQVEVSRDNDAALELYRGAGYVDYSPYLMTKWLNHGES